MFSSRKIENNIIISLMNYPLPQFEDGYFTTSNIKQLYKENFGEVHRQSITNALKNLYENDLLFFENVGNTQKNYYVINPYEIVNKLIQHSALYYNDDMLNTLEKFKKQDIQIMYFAFKLACAGTLALAGKNEIEYTENEAVAFTSENCFNNLQNIWVNDKLVLKYANKLNAKYFLQHVKEIQELKDRYTKMKTEFENLYDDFDL